MPTIRHPDLSPSNILISKSADWQHAAILPLFLQAKIPKHFQNYGDDDSENFRPPKLADDFAAMTTNDKEAEQELYQRRQVHYFYLGFTNRLNKAHFNALAKIGLQLTNQLYDVAGRPWEGDNTSLHAQLIRTGAQWSEFGSPGDSPPVLYSPAESKDCLDTDAEQKDIDEEMQALRDCIGVNIDGLVVHEEFESAVQRAQSLKRETMNGAETAEEKREIDELWPFQDHVEID